MRYSANSKPHSGIYFSQETWEKIPGEAKPSLFPDFIPLERPRWPIKNSVSQTAQTGTFLPVQKGEALVSQVCYALHKPQKVMSSQKEDPPDNLLASGSFSFDDAICET